MSKAYEIHHTQICKFSFADIKQMISEHTIESHFQIGDTIIVPWTNPANKKDYDMPFIFAHFGHNFKNENGAFKFGVGFVSQYSLPETYIFDNKEPDNPNWDRKRYGNNRWMYSNIRQYLNKSGFNWYEAQHEYDVQPNIYFTYKGFLDTLPSDLVDFVSPVQISTQTATVDGNVVDITIDKFFLLSIYEMNSSNSKKDSDLAEDGVEGEPWQWYKNLNNGTFFNINSLNCEFKKFNIIDIKRACNMLVRSACLKSSHYTWYIHKEGMFFGNCSSELCGFAPAFVILED